MSQTQRWAHYLTLLFSVLALFVGINLRDSTLNATVAYVNVQAGISASYPRNWLLDQAPDYVFRVRDMTQPGFKTTIQVAVRPVSEDTSVRNVLDALALNRAQTLDGYNIIGVEPYVLPDETRAIRVLSTYVDTEANPFLQGVPVSVEAIDVVAIKGGQAIIITFISDAQLFDINLPIFEQFLLDLEF
ncbi:MAG: hypothetical protein HXY40_19865 [Chloroflexi bacterium]|nr:hypothetical protein [Chloroflexota bacterium]